MNVFIVLDAYDKFVTDSQMKTKLFLEKCSGEKCLLVHFTEIKKGEIEALNPTSIMFSGGGVAFEENHDVLENGALKKLMFEWEGPKLAICYSFQLNVIYHGGEVGEIGKMETGDHDPNPEYHRGRSKFCVSEPKS